MRALLALLCAVTGCSAADPCDGLAGSCISARVEGALTGLDNLRVILGSGPGPGQPMTSVPGSRFDLPVRLAILLPPGTASPATLGIEALSSGQVVGTSGDSAVPFAANGKTPFTFTVGVHGPGALVDGGLDGPPPGVLSFFPASLDFGPANRGTQTMSKAIRLYNNTARTVTTVSAPQPTGDGQQFVLDFMQTTCFAGDAGMNPTVSLPAGGSCAIGFSFFPQKSGSFLMTVPTAFDDGETPSFTVTGQGVPAWSAELAGSSATNLQAVWGANPNDVYAVAQDSSGPTVLHTDGSGVWTRWLMGPNNLPAALFGVSGSDAQRVWVGGQGSAILFETGPQTWIAETVPVVGQVQGLWARDTITVFAATLGGQIVRRNTASWNSTLAAPAPNPFNAICGFGQRNVAVGDSAQLYATDPAGGTWSAVSGVFGGYTGSLRGCWMSDVSNVWVVGAPGNGLSGLFHCVANGNAWSCTHESGGPVTMNLAAVAGRVVPGSSALDIYAVGSLGNFLLHSDGGGTWAPTVNIPNNMAMNGVWVSRSGEVFAVGGNGQVNHLY